MVFTDLRGFVHCHTTHSDGRASVEQRLTDAELDGGADDPLVRLIARGPAGYRFVAKALLHALGAQGVQHPQAVAGAAALAAALPCRTIVGFPRRSETTSISRHDMPTIPVPRALLVASFAANRTASSGTRPRQYATSAGVKIRVRNRSPHRTITAATRSISIKSTPHARVIVLAPFSGLVGPQVDRVHRRCVVPS